MFKCMLVVTLGIFAKTAFPQSDLTLVSSGMFQLSAIVDIVSHKQTAGFELTFDGKSGGFFGCESGKTTFKWPGFAEKINEETIYNFTFAEKVSKKVDVFTQDDFYCDAFTGKQRKEIFWTATNLNQNVGKKLKIQVEGVLTVAASKNNKRRLETIALTSVEFYAENKMVLKFNRSEKGPLGQAHLVWLATE